MSRGSGTWIPLHADVFFNRKIVRAARRLTKGDVEKLVGHLARLWTWAADHAESGDLSHLQRRAIAAAAGWTGDEHRFVNVLVEAGLLDSGPAIHEFERYSGRLVARRKSDRERKEAARNAAKQAEAAKLSAGLPTVDDSDRTETAIAIDDVVGAHAVRGTDVSVADGSRSSDGIGRSQETVEANVERALDVLRRVRWYPVSEAQDIPLLKVASLRAPMQDLAADVTRWVKTAKGTVRRPRASLAAWLRKFGDQDRPVDRPPTPEALAAELAYNRDPSSETRGALVRARGAL